MRYFTEYLLAIPEQDPRYILGMNTLLDCRLATDPAKTTPRDDTEYRLVLDQIAKSRRATQRRKLAVVVADLVSFGLSRMRAAPLLDSLLEFGVYQSVPEALLWLGLPVELEKDLIVDDLIQLQISASPYP